MRRDFSKAVKLAAWDRCGGRCEGCGVKLFPGRFQYDHIVAFAIGGEPTLDNCQVLCSGGRATCHGLKTAEQDTPRAAKTKRQHAKNLGIRSRRSILDGSRASKWKKKLDGSVVRRDA